MTQKETILAFVETIHAHDICRLGELMIDSHTVVDPYGNAVTKRESMLAGWRGYFEWFPDYQIEVRDNFEAETEFAMFGIRAWVRQRKYRSKIAPTRSLESLGAR